MNTVSVCIHKCMRFKHSKSTLKHRRRGRSNPCTIRTRASVTQTHTLSHRDEREKNPKSNIFHLENLSGCMWQQAKRTNKYNTQHSTTYFESSWICSFSLFLCVCVCVCFASLFYFVFGACVIECVCF